MLTVGYLGKDDTRPTRIKFTKKLQGNAMTAIVQGGYLISLGQYSNRGCACVKPSTSFSCRHPLYSVDAALKLELAIHALATDGSTSKLAATLFLRGCYLYHLKDTCSDVW